MSENQDLFFEPSLFSDADSTSSNAIVKEIPNKIYNENEAQQLFASDKFWLEKPILDDGQLEMLYNLAETLCLLFRRHNVEAWIDGGTLLGSIRHGGLIPWDDDLDFTTFKHNEKTFTVSIVPDLRRAGYDIVPWWYNGYRIFHRDGRVLEKYPDCKYPFADLFFVKMSKSEKGLIEYANERAKLMWPSGLTIDDLRPLKMIKFGRLMLPMPKDPANHLTALYGDHWPNVVYRDYNHLNSTYFDRVYVRLNSFAAALPFSDR